MSTLFVSDVHLSQERPGAVNAFLSFLAGPARQADGLYVLGDLFDQWLGDDDDTPPHPDIMDALSKLTAAGVPVGVMHGNHDFLLGASFVERTGCELLGDATRIDLYGTPALIMHGDSLCVDDEEYQAWRRYTRDREVQAQFLALPLAARAARAREVRHLSEELTQLKPEDIMDVNGNAVLEVMRDNNVLHLIHGHTHRPAIHDLMVDGAPGRRIVLGDWYEGNSVLVWEKTSYRLGTLDETVGEQVLQSAPGNP